MHIALEVLLVLVAVLVIGVLSASLEAFCDVIFDSLEPAAIPRENPHPRSFRTHFPDLHHVFFMGTCTGGL